MTAHSVVWELLITVQHLDCGRSECPWEPWESEKGRWGGGLEMMFNQVAKTVVALNRHRLEGVFL